MDRKEGILLESGTNEVEVLEFELDGQGFGVNVLKVQAIEQFDTGRVTEIQLAHEAVIGGYHYRDGVITLVDLGHALAVGDPERNALDAREVAAVQEAMAATGPLADQAVPRAEAPEDAAGAETGAETGSDAGGSDIETRIVLVLEFNEQTTGFLVGGVNRIHRISWDAISPLSPFLAQVESKFTGSLNIEGREILVVDMERILADILPATGASYLLRERGEQAPTEADRADVPVVLAEDSVTIRAVLSRELQRGGYQQLEAFDNGESCHEALRERVERARAEGRDPAAAVGVVVSDIEMPRMDGMTLCRRVKQDLGLSQVPVILFSSLINEQIARKCESVGADAYISKPRFNELLEMVDQHVFGS
jgi:two-component system chemotaxis response regulator CheV